MPKDVGSSKRSRTPATIRETIFLGASQQFNTGTDT